MKRALWVGYVIVVGAVLYFLYLAVGTPGVFDAVLLDEKSSAALVVVVGLYTLAIAIGAFVWFRLLTSVGQRVRPIVAVSVVFLSQAAKYIPGNVAHHVGRVVLAKKHGLSTSATLFSMFLETLWVIAIAALLALVALWSVGSRLFVNIPQVPEWWVLSILIIAAMLAPLIGHRVFERLAGWWAARKSITLKSVQMPPMRTFCLVGMLYVVNYLVLGIVLTIIAAQIFGAKEGNILLLSGVFAVAWVAGFVTPGAPAGLGVREVVLVGALTPVYDHGTAIGVAAMLRVVTVLGDGLAFLIGLGLDRWVLARPKTA